jgi:hypothetical protein
MRINNWRMMRASTLFPIAGNAVLLIARITFHSFTILSIIGSSFGKVVT